MSPAISTLTTNTGTLTTQHQVGRKGLGKQLLQCVLSRHKLCLTADIPTPSHGLAAQKCKRPEEEEEEGKAKELPCKKRVAGEHKELVTLSRNTNAAT